MNKKYKISVLILSGLFLVGHAQAESSTSNRSERYEYDYPELSVVPRASDRLKMEADKERDRKFTQFLPIQIPALTTLAAGIASFDSSNSGAGSIGIGVGLGWLVATAALSFTYEPYLSANYRMNALPKSTLRDQLTRERMGEEELRAAASFGSKMKWLSWITNVGASVYMITQFKSGSPGDTTLSRSDLTRGLEFSSLLMAFTPFIFKFNWNDVYDTQMEYKKRIYAPVAMATFLNEPGSQKLTPGILFNLKF